MNVKPGDLAVVLSATSVIACRATDRVVTVISRVHGERAHLPDGKVVILNGPAMWIVLFPSEIEIPTTNGGIYKSRHWVMHDHRLRPIRDPGDDAVDQMVERVGKPNEVTA